MIEESSVEALFGKIEQVPQQTTNVNLWVPVRLTLRGAEVPSDVAMAIVLAHLLDKGLHARWLHPKCRRSHPSLPSRNVKLMMRKHKIGGVDQVIKKLLTVLIIGSF